MHKGSPVWEARFLSISLFALAMFPAISTVSAGRGQAVYQGREPLQGRIRGHDDVLPPEAVRCTNCHSEQKGSRLSGPPAPQLEARWLLQPRQRHGGPPSSYDQRSFCRLLRAGSDPVYVLVAREMPIYDIDDSQCASLWLFLSTKEVAHEAH